jgi:hypothetical protein
MWKELSTEFVVHFSMEKCPMLIGIMRQSARDENWLSSIDYECTLLQQDDTLTRIQVKSSLETLLCELIYFKEECNDNEKILVSLCYFFFS